MAKCYYCEREKSNLLRANGQQGRLICCQCLLRYVMSGEVEDLSPIVSVPSTEEKPEAVRHG